MQSRLAPVTADKQLFSPLIRNIPKKAKMMASLKSTVASSGITTIVF